MLCIVLVIYLCNNKSKQHIMKLKNLPTGQYQKTGTNYISLIDGNGCTCDNCGRLIANMVSVMHETGKSFTIGQDCAKTLFDEKTNKEIDLAIKNEKKKKEKEAKQFEYKLRKERLNEFMEACKEAGIDNSNCNDTWAREKRNSILDTLEKKHGCYITYRA